MNISEEDAKKYSKVPKKFDSLFKVIKLLLKDFRKS